MSMQSEGTSTVFCSASFNSLPYELRSRIIEAACGYDECIGLFGHKDAVNFMLVSRSVYATAASYLYKAIWITSPTTLAAFSRAIVSKPALGRLVKALFLGPPWHLPRDWWPLRHLHGPSKVFKSPSIGTSVKDESLLPFGCTRHQRWPLRNVKSAHTNERDTAIQEAIKAAQTAIGIDLRSPRKAPDGQEIGSSLWLIGVMEVQAALDLYLIELRRREDEASRLPRIHSPTNKKRKASSGSSYPALILTTSTSSSPGATSSSKTSHVDTPPFSLHRTKLLQHLFRRGGPADHFDSPILFARSGIKLLSFDAQGKARVSASIWDSAAALYADSSSSELNNDAFASLAVGTAASNRAPLAQDLASSGLDQANYNTASVGGNLALARVLLALVPNVEDLYITGFLQRTICGHGAALPPPSLRSLSLGPLTSFSDESLCPAFEHGQLAKLELLYLRGSFVADRKRDCLIALPKLIRAEWALCWHDKEASE